MEKYEELITKLLNKNADELNKTEKSVLEHLRKKKPISRDINKEKDEHLTYGQRVADKVASFGGSWPFIGIFIAILVIWITANITLLKTHNKQFDPFPYILLNLFLSMLAALQVPVIMMSQNRHSEHDRIDAQHDYEVNLKAELEIQALHEKIDALKSELEFQVLQDKFDELKAEIDAFVSAATKDK